MNNYHKYIYPVLLLCILFFMLSHPALTLQGSRHGLLLWFRTVLPTLLPYLILSNLLLSCHSLPRLLTIPAPVFHRLFGLSTYGSFALMVGLLCGYPMGAKMTADLYRQGRIHLAEAQYLLATANNPSPAFLITYVIQQNLPPNVSILRTVLLFYTGSYLTMLLWRLTHKLPPDHSTHILCRDSKKETSKTLSKGERIDASIMNSFETVTRLGGYIILCSILTALLETTPLSLYPLKMILSCITEITTGVQTITNAALPWALKYPLTLSASAFGGLCIMLQTNSVIRNSGLTLKPYLMGKTIQSIITVLLFLIIVT